jgi:hypothetical protein
MLGHQQCVSLCSKRAINSAAAVYAYHLYNPTAHCNIPTSSIMYCVSVITAAATAVHSIRSTLEVRRMSLLTALAAHVHTAALHSCPSVTLLLLLALLLLLQLLLCCSAALLLELPSTAAA